MAKQQVLIIGHCFGSAGSEPDSEGRVTYHRKGTVLELDDKKKEESKLMTDLFAAGRIVPVTKANLIRCRGELEKEILKQKRDALRDKVELTKENTLTVPGDIATALAAIAADEAKK